MAAMLVILYVCLSLLSPAVFPPAIASLRINLIVGVLAILFSIPRFLPSGYLKQPDLPLILGFLLVCILSLAFTGWLGSIPIFLSGFWPILIAYPLVAVTCNNERSLRWMVNALTCVALYILAMAFIAEHSANYQSPYLLVQGLGEGGVLYRYRGMGVLSDPNDTAQFLLVVAALQWIRWKEEQRARNFLVVLIPASLLLVGIYLTHSRGGALACLAALLFAVRRKLGVVLTALTMGIGIAALLLLNLGGGRGMAEDDGDRVGLWANGLTMLRSNLFLGVGPGNFEDFSYAGFTAHNSYILCLAETGTLGYLLWIALILLAWGTLSSLVNARIATPSAKVCGAYQLQIAMVGFLAAAFFLSRTYSMLLYVLLGLAAGMRLNAMETAPSEFTQPVGGLLLRSATMVVVSVVGLYLAVKILG